ncbi:MAG: glycosyltransferase family 39 protein [Chloroflexota bacterium]
MNRLTRNPFVQCAVLALLVVLVALPILSYPMGRDQGMYANIGRGILQGATPFVDIWDIKPPPIYYIYALGIGIFGSTTASIRALDLLFVPAGMLGLLVLGKYLTNNRVGLLSALLYGAFYFNDGFQNLTQSDSLATVITIWVATALVIPAHPQKNTIRWRWLMLAGLLTGLLLWFKPQQYVLVVGALVLYAVWSRWEHGWLSILRDGSLFALGGLLTGGSLLVYFWSQGIIAEIFIVAEGTAAYNAQGYDVGAFIDNMRLGLYWRWTVWHGLILLAILWGILVSWRAITQEKDDRQASRLLILWLVGGFAFAFVQAKGFDTHWFPLLPPLALMGGYALHYMLDYLSERTSQIILPILVIAILAVPASTTYGNSWRYLIGQQTLADYWDGFQANDLKPEESLAVAHYLRERVQAGNSLFIWGFRPEVYYMADLRPATRYQAHFPLVAPWYPTAWQQENVDILWAALPTYVLVLEDDFMPWVTDYDADSHTLLQSYTELNNWLIANYERVDEIGDFIIWRRTP